MSGFEQRDILDELRRDHAVLREAMTELESGVGRARFERFARELAHHAHTEDELLFRELEADLPADHGPLAALRSDHVEIESELDRLVRHGVDGDAPLDPAAVRRLVALAREHFLKEERVLFAFATRLIDGPRLIELGEAFRALNRQPAATEPFDRATRVADLARARPETIRVFQRHGVDFCCGGKRSLADACAAHGLDYGRFAADLAAALAAPPDDPAPAWGEAPTPQLVGHLLARYHAGLREELARLEAMAARANERHGAEHPELVRVAGSVARLRRAMVDHLTLEEREIFPALLAERFDEVARQVQTAEADHDEVGRLLADLRQATGGFEPPDWACNTWRGLYAGLAELERETHVHVHLENNVLFPRAAALAAAR
jgi:regulator of cell morphogenesis and NO signaling